VLREKICSGCGAVKPNTTDFFSKHKPSPDGLRPNCKECQRKYSEKYLPKHRVQRRQYDQEYINKWRYNVNKAKLIELQNGRCANEACRAPIDLSTGCVDHDHSCCPLNKSCGKCVRGVLCQMCNKSAGLIGDSASKLRGLAEYLERHLTKEQDHA
jgi:Recombination endonuclease VII